MYTTDTNYNELVAAAKLAGIKYVGLKKEALVEALNAKAQTTTEGTSTQTPAQRSQKWYEEEGFKFQAGQVVNVVAGPLHGRQAIVDKPSAKKNAVKAYLIKPGTERSLQKTNITLDYDKIEVAADAAVLQAV